MAGKEDGPDKGAIGKNNRYDAEEEVMLSEGRRLSVWALLGAAVFVVAMIVLALVVFKSGGPNPGSSG
jgi:uncharacterized membrane protein YidH (DUF202 family)